MVDRSRPLRVLSVAHSAVRRSSSRLRYDALAADPALDVHLVVPKRWHEFGRWYDADPSTGDDTGVALHRLPIRLPRAGRASWHLHHYPELPRLAATLRPDVIHLWEEPWSIVALQGASIARRLGAALVLEVDQNILKRLPPPFEIIRRHTLRRTQVILSRSPDATDVVRACGFEGAAFPIGYGVDEKAFFPTRRPAPGSLKLGYVGRLVEEKGLDDVLQAMTTAPASIHLSIIGEGPHEAALRAHANRAGLADRVEFRPWSSPETVGDFLRGQHALLLMTRTTSVVREQFGRVIIEAQACGTPVIGADSGAIPSVIGEGGWVVPERDPAALSALLHRLAIAPDEIAHRSREGVANVATRFTCSAVAGQLAEGLRVAAARGAATPARRFGLFVRRPAIPALGLAIGGTGSVAIPVAAHAWPDKKVAEKVRAHQ